MSAAMIFGKPVDDHEVFSDESSTMSQSTSVSTKTSSQSDNQTEPSPIHFEQKEENVYVCDGDLYTQFVKALKTMFDRGSICLKQVQQIVLKHPNLTRLYD